MALPTDNSFGATCTSTPAYVVYRDISNGEPSDPTSPLLFFPPKGSDELFDALRTAFPHLKSHSERMRDAIIQFLLEERQEELLRTSAAQTMDGTAPTTTTWLSASSSSSSSSSASASVSSSPDLLDFATPSSLSTSPQTLPPQLTRTASVAASSQASPPSLDQMTGVFSLSAESQPKQHMRRKMTEAEKVEYRKRRIVKACDKCAKRKRKCPHNQTQMEIIPASSSKSAAHVSKRKLLPKSNFDVNKNGQQNCAAVEPVMAAENWDFTAGLDMSSTFQSFDDFPMFEDPFAEFTVDGLVQWDQPATNFQPHDHHFTPNSVPCSWSGPSSGSNSQSDSGLLHLANTVQPVPGATGDLQQLGQHGDLTNHSNDRSSLATSHQRSRRSSHNGTRTRSDVWPELTHLHGSLQQVDRQDIVEDGRQIVSGDGMLWKHVHPGSQAIPRPTRTAHVHNAGCGELSGSTEASEVLKRPRLKETLGQSTLKLVGKTKALRTGAGLARSSDCSSALQSSPISRRRATDALKYTTEPPHIPCGECTRPSNARASERREGQFAANAVDQQHWVQKSTSVSQPGRLRIGIAALRKGSSTPVIASSAAKQQKQRRLPTTLAEGALKLGNMSTELYMLRRRIPHKPVTSQNYQHIANSKAETCQLATHAIGGAHLGLRQGGFPAARTTERCMAAQAHFTFTPALEKASAKDHMLCHDNLRKLPQQDRLHDYHKIQDHHVRSLTAMALLLLGLIAMLFANTLPIAALPALWYSFSSFFPDVVAAADERKEELVQRSEINSSWLSLHDLKSSLASTSAIFWRCHNYKREEICSAFRMRARKALMMMMIYPLSSDYSSLGRGLVTLV
ncbi:hypothetical protein SMMN14_03841 [Sphaerulina musiva]